MSFHSKIITTTTTNTYASGLKVTITEDPKEDEKSKLMSRHEMGTMITRLTNRVNKLEETIERVNVLADDFDPSPMADLIREALNDKEEE